jgi:hypothetical protein
MPYQLLFDSCFQPYKSAFHTTFFSFHLIYKHSPKLFFIKTKRLLFTPKPFLMPIRRMHAIRSLYKLCINFRKLCVVRHYDFEDKN